MMYSDLVGKLEKECLHSEIVAADGVRLWSAWFDRSRAEEILAEWFGGALCGQDVKCSNIVHACVLPCGHEGTHRSVCPIASATSPELPSQYSTDAASGRVGGARKPENA